jgi:hypothetical protein
MTVDEAISRQAKREEIPGQNHPPRDPSGDPGRGPMVPFLGNTQPWAFSVITGAPLAELKKAIQAKRPRGNRTAPTFPCPKPGPSPEKPIQRNGKLILSSLSIAREDKASRTVSTRRWPSCSVPPA